MRRIYLDYAATTPVVQEAIDAMASFWAERFGNAGSVHSFGQEAQRAIDAARMRIAESFGARREEILFTASATEANNLAIRGVVDAWRGGKARAMPHLVTSVLEHESVLETCRDLERRGKASVSYIGVTPEGIIRLEELERALREETALVSVQYANNEIGTIQPILEIAQIIRDFREKSEMNNEQLFEPEGSSEPERLTPPPSVSHSPYPLFHTDASQAVQFLAIEVEGLGVDFLTVSSHKIYGPKGIGALYVRHKIENSSLISPFSFLSPLITGGGQEYGLRSGTEHVPLIAGFAKAIEYIWRKKGAEGDRIASLRDRLYSAIVGFAPDAALNGSRDARLPNNLNIYFPNHRADELVLRLDRKGVAVSAGSACRAKSTEPSYVLHALGLGDNRAIASIRISLGRPTTEREVEGAIKIFRAVLQ